MDDDNKIIKPSEFLPEATKEESDVHKLYDLSEEFEKTKYNKSNFTLTVIILFIIGLTGTALLITHFIQKYNENLSIDIKDFEDVNLVDLLNATKKYENDLNLINQEIGTIQQKREKEIDALKKETEQQIETLTQNGSSQAAKNRLKALYTAESKKKEQLLQNKYQDELAQKERERDLVLARIESYDKRQLEKAKKNEEILQNQQRLHELELQKTINEYEGKLSVLRKQQQNEVSTLNNRYKRETARLIATYNPLFRDATLDSVLQANNQPAESDPYTKFDQLGSEMPELKRSLQKNADKLRQFDMMYGRLKAIPYINSVPSLLKGAEYSTKNMINEFLIMTKKLSEEIRQQEQVISEEREMERSYHNALQKLARSNGDMGLIINADNSQAVIFYYNEILALKQGTRAKVFRYDDEYIGTIQIYRYKNGFRGNVTDLKNGAALQPLDRLLFDLKQNIPSGSDATSD